MRTIPASVLIVAVTCLCPGNTAVAQPPAERPGVVFILEGVGGFEVFATSANWALPRADVKHELREFVWTHGWGKLFRDLQDVRHLLRKGEELAEEIRRYRAEYPDRPVYLLAKSGGTAVALAAAERLPPNSLERLILLSSAVSPCYDLRPALRATRGEIVSFHSMNDQFVLRWGTGHFGTADRFYGPSAGFCGFVVPRDLAPQDRALYDRLVQMPWQPAMLRDGHAGGHAGTSMPTFLARHVAPWLKPPAER